MLKKIGPAVVGTYAPGNEVYDADVRLTMLGREAATMLGQSLFAAEFDMPIAGSWDTIMFTDGKENWLCKVPVGATARSGEEPLLINGGPYWLYRGVAYRALDNGLTSDDVRALVVESEDRRRIRLEQAHAVEAVRRDPAADRRGRDPIPHEVKIDVWRRDGGQCVECQSHENLEFDHIIPLAMGGANTFRNLQLLCASCNRRKGPSLG